MLIDPRDTTILHALDRLGELELLLNALGRKRRLERGEEEPLWGHEELLRRLELDPAEIDPDVNSD